MGIKWPIVAADNTVMNETSDGKGAKAAASMRQEIYRTILAGQERFAYFFLAASGSAIAFAFIRTDGHSPACWMLPIAVAVLCWGLSFYRGCEHLLFQRKVLLANWKTLNIQGGMEPLTSGDPTLAASALERLRENADKDNRESRAYGRQQYVLFLLGALFYGLGHVQHLCQLGR
jgi:hypothetical protein